MIGADKVLLPRKVYYVSLSANTSTTTALDLAVVAAYLSGAGAEYRGYWRFAAASDFHLLAGNKNVPTIDLTVDNDGDEGWPVYGKQTEPFVATGADNRYLKFRGGAAATTVAIYKG